MKTDFDENHRKYRDLELQLKKLTPDERARMERDMDADPAIQMTRRQAALERKETVWADLWPEIATTEAEALARITQGKDTWGDEGGVKQTTLMQMISINATERALVLIEKGANVHTCTEAGNNPLIYAAMQDNEPVARMLIAKGADVNYQRKDDGMTPLMFAASFGTGHVVKRLLDSGANLNAADKKGYTAVDMAQGNMRKVEGLVDLMCEYKRPKIIRKLLSVLKQVAAA